MYLDCPKMTNIFFVDFLADFSREYFFQEELTPRTLIICKYLLTKEREKIDLIGRIVI